jgi:hypothetical protein
MVDCNPIMADRMAEMMRIGMTPMWPFDVSYVCHIAWPGWFLVDHENKRVVRYDASTVFGAAMPLFVEAAALNDAYWDAQ